MSRSEGEGARRTMAAVIARIRQSYRDMTPTNRVLAEYVLEHHQELAFASAARVAAQAGLSPATVVRFAESLGLSGYAELQALARDALRQEVDTVAQLKRASERSDPRSVLALALRADIANLEQTLDRVSEKTFARAIDVLTRAPCIHLVGLRSTFGLVRHFESYLGWIGRKAQVLRPGIGDLPEQIMRIAPGDACIGVSFRRYTRETVEIFKAARSGGALTIAMTDSELSPLADHADLTFVIPVQFPAFFESRVAALSIMNALVFGIALADRPHTLEALRRHEEAWSAHDTYFSESFRARFQAEIEAFANSRVDPFHAGQEPPQPRRARAKPMPTRT
jgi:DNA-binding MurR/RpiR family transcriptional regulator